MYGSTPKNPPDEVHLWKFFEDHARKMARKNADLHDDYGTIALAALTKATEKVLYDLPSHPMQLGTAEDVRWRVGGQHMGAFWVICIAVVLE